MRRAHLLVAGMLRLLPCLLLVLVAVVQLWLAHTADLTPWSGGGFGMFSTLDSRGGRHLHAYAIRPGIRRELVIPYALQEMESRVLALPSDANLRRLARELARIPVPDEGPVREISIQVWATRYSPETLQPHRFLLRGLRVEGFQ